MRSSFGTPDKFELLAMFGEYVVAVLASKDLSDIELVDIDDTERVLLPEVQSLLRARGLQFIAAAGIVNGKPEIEMVFPLPEDTAFAIGMALNRHIYAKANRPAPAPAPAPAKNTGDSLAFLEALWSLRDPRPDA